MKQFILGLVIGLLFTQCGSDYLLQDSAPISQGAWAYADVKRFEVSVTDTLAPYDFYFHVRQGGDYAFRNIIIKVKTYFPNNTFITDTIDCPLADPQGNWYGKGLGDILENEVLFKKNVQMPVQGNYIFEIQHAMRFDTLQAVYDVGLAIEKAVN